LREQHNQRNPCEPQSDRSAGRETGAGGELRLKNARGFLRKNDTKGFRYWKLGNLAISANFGGIHYEDISEAL
jgi:hypothetical protein